MTEDKYHAQALEHMLKSQRAKDSANETWLEVYNAMFRSAVQVGLLPQPETLDRELVAILYEELSQLSSVSGVSLHSAWLQAQSRYIERKYSAISDLPTAQTAVNVLDSSTLSNLDGTNNSEEVAPADEVYSTTHSVERKSLKTYEGLNVHIEARRAVQQLLAQNDWTEDEVYKEATRIRQQWIKDYSPQRKWQESSDRELFYQSVIKKTFPENWRDSEKFRKVRKFLAFPPERA